MSKVHILGLMIRTQAGREGKQHCEEMLAQLII